MPFDPPRSHLAARRICGCAVAPLLAAWLLGAAGSAWAQSQSPPAQDPAATATPFPDQAPTQAPAQGQDQVETPDKGLHDFSFIALPIPISNPTIGSGFAVGLGAFYKAGGSETPWVTGLAFLYTNTESWALALVQKANLADDRFRLLAAGGGGELHVDYYGVGAGAGDRDVSVPITQNVIFGTVQGLARVAPNLYAGLQYRYLDMSTSLHIVPPPFPDLDLPPAELESVSSALGPSIEYDTRDSEYQTSNGIYATGVWLIADKAFGSDRDYSRAEARINGYRRLDPKSVLAWRASACVAGDDAPFYDICNYGSQSDLRGYASGQYRDRALLAVQAEYRRALFGRFGAVAFAGVGGVGPDLGSIGDAFLPSAGVGLRFEASGQYGVNVGVDYAVGKDSSAFYFRIGEAF